LIGEGVGFAARLLDHDGPAERFERRGHAEHLHAATFVYSSDALRVDAIACRHQAHQRLDREVVARARRAAFRSSCHGR
jgi:hypothetical protein